MVRFQKMAKEAMETASTGTVISRSVTGGTGFYIQALLYDIDFTENGGQIRSYREGWRRWRKEREPDTLHNDAEKRGSCLGGGDPCQQCQAGDPCPGVFPADRRTDLHPQSAEARKKPPTTVPIMSSMQTGPGFMSGLTGGWTRCWKTAWWRRWSGCGTVGCTRELVSMQGLGYKEILACLDGETSLGGGCGYPKAGHPAFCQAAAHLVQAGAGCDLDRQGRFCL